MSPRISYENELEELSRLLNMMCAQVEYSYDRLFEANGKKDEESIHNIIKNDRVVNDMERKIESKCLMLITRQQPIVGDLRLVSAALKVVTDLEREGDHVVDMAELLLRLKDSDISIYSRHILQMIAETKEMLHASVDAFINRNTEDAKRVIETDEIIDTYFNKVKEDIIGHIRSNARDIDECVDMLMLAKYLEKMGDHAVNIGEWTIFRETGDMEGMRLL